MEKIKKYRADMALGRILAIYWVVLIQHNFAPIIQIGHGLVMVSILYLIEFWILHHILHY